MRKREKILLVTALAFVCVALLKVFVVGPAFDRWSAGVREERDLEAALAKARALASRHDDLVAKRAALSKKLRPSGEASEGPVPSFLAVIRALAERARFSPLSLRNVRREDTGTYTLYVFWLRARTDLGAITSFLAELKALEACIRVTSLTLSRSGARATRADELDADMVLVALAEGAPEGKERQTAAAGRRPR